MGAARKKLIIPNYARDTTSPHDFVKPSKQKERGRLDPMSIAVACCTCHVAGTILMPQDIDVVKLADKMFNGRIIRGFCENCRQMVEFRPFTPKQLEENKMDLWSRYLDIHDLSVVQKNAEDAKKFASPADSIHEVLKANDEYMKDLRERMKGKAPMIQNGPQENKSGSIIIP